MGTIQKPRCSPFSMAFFRSPLTCWMYTRANSAFHVHQSGPSACSLQSNRVFSAALAYIHHLSQRNMTSAATSAYCKGCCKGRWRTCADTRL